MKSACAAVLLLMATSGTAVPEKPWIKLPGSYFLDMRHYQPAVTAARLAIPILVMQGERDFHVDEQAIRDIAAFVAGRH